MINIMQKSIKRLNPLTDPAIKHLPFAGRNNAWHAVKRDQPFRAIIFAINIKGNPHPVKQQRSFLFVALDCLLIGLLQPLPVGLIMAAVFAFSHQHFIKKG